MARASKPERKDGTSAETNAASGGNDGANAANDDLIDLPFDGLVGRQETIFSKTLDEFDPIQAAYDNLPGKEGSPERKAAIDKLIQERVKLIASSGYEELSLDKDPMADVTPLQLLMETLRTTDIGIDSKSEFALAYLLSALVAFFILGGVTLFNDSFQAFLVWFQATDFAGLAPSFLRL